MECTRMSAKTLIHYSLCYRWARDVNHFPTLSLLFLVLLATVSGTYIGWATSGGQECNTRLSAKIGFRPIFVCRLLQ